MYAHKMTCPRKFIAVKMYYSLKWDTSQNFTNKNQINN